jgi:Asp-tRNA(Asn)/Glu-tRNA(Gln) amidotransferase C subunit
VSVKSRSKSKKEEERDLTPDLISHLERTSLVDFESEEALRRLRSAIEFSDILFEVDTTGIEPMTSLLDDQ